MPESPPSVGALELLARAIDDAAQGKRSAARVAARSARAVATTSQERRLVGLVLAHLGEIDDALAALEVSSERDLEGALASLEARMEVAFRSGRYQVARETMEQALALEPSAAWFERAADFLQSVGDPVGGLGHLKSAIARSPLSIPLRLKGAERYIRFGLDAAARTEVAEILKLGFEVEGVRLTVGRMQMSLGDFKDAEEHLRSATAPRVEPRAAKGPRARVLAPGQEAVVREMVSPALPPGWRFLGCKIGAGASAGYQHSIENLTARLELSPPVGDSPRAPVRLSWTVSRATASTMALRAAVGAAIQKQQHALSFHAVAQGENADEPLLRSSENRARADLALAELQLWRADADDVKSALEGIERALHVDGRSAPAHRLRGVGRMLGGDLEGALGDIEAALRLDDLDAEAYLWRAEIASRRGDLERALDDVARIGELVEDLSDHVPAQLLRLALLQALDCFPGAPSHGVPEAMVLLSPGNPRSFRAALDTMKGNRSTTPTFVSVLDGTLHRLTVPPTPRAASKNALMLLGARGTEAALAEFVKVHARHPDAPEPHCYHGELYLYLGRYAEARAEFDRALVKYPRTRWAFIGLGAVELMEGHASRALEALQRGIDLSGAPGPTTFVYRGEARLSLGDLEGARADLEHACQSQPRRIGAWVDLGLLEARRGKIDALRSIVERLLCVAPALIHDAAIACGEAARDEMEADASPEIMERVLAKTLELMRGNRSSTVPTWISTSGELRVVTLGQASSIAAADSMNGANSLDALAALRKLVESAELPAEHAADGARLTPARAPTHD